MRGGPEPCSCMLCGKLARREKAMLDGTPRGRRGRPPGSLNVVRVVDMTPKRPVGRPPGRPSGRLPGRPPGRPPGRVSARPPGRPFGSGLRPILDREGAPDVFKMAVMRLKERGFLDEGIKETGSMDWRAERTALDEYIEQLGMQPSYIPRPGEVVLWIPDYEGELAWNQESRCIQIYSPDQDRWLGTPEWRAGIIGQTPEEDTVLQDLVKTVPKKWGANYSGFRVETFPDPNSHDKSYSLHYKYVHLKCIKPFNAYELFLQGTPLESLHPSIEYAMTIMSSFSLLDKYHFKGVWPDAAIYSRGIFIGTELLIVGDAVRLKPNGQYSLDEACKAVEDVMVIDEIRLELIHCVDEVKSDQLAERYQVRIAGKVYTNSAQRSNAGADGLSQQSPMKPEEVIDVFQSVGMSGYGNWYRVWRGATVEVSQNMIIGRCYDPDAMKLLYGSRSLGLDLTGVVKGREYSRQVDGRIPEGKDWFWGDFRTQTLAIDTLNGEDVGYYSEVREVRMWRANLRVLDGIADAADLRDARIPGDVGRPSTKIQSNFAEVGKTSKLVSTGLGGADASNPVSSEEVASPPNEEDSSESEEDFSLRMDQLRGGTEESEGGDYQPER
ncbi:transcription-silencing protein Clr2-domain-containing protein [Aspergillus coremiiformis]|uniref:Transcription-silencing protein Clr2-domain-containing protein n=1 Tax=Aspergillus coremiiformis TaxID=138285 RepID=A0A5N6Z227_9EURO|nr:transcription-silencing protein Clr2-domain-containing protein [Aspergillus coremiiformis]